MACEPGDEARVQALAAELDATIRALRGRLGEIGDRRITVIAGLTVLDRLQTAEAKIAELKERTERLERLREADVLAADADAGPLIARLDVLTATVDALTATARQGTRAAHETRGLTEGPGTGTGAGRPGTGGTSAEGAGLPGLPGPPGVATATFGRAPSAAAHSRTDRATAPERRSPTGAFPSAPGLAPDAASSPSVAREIGATATGSTRSSRPFAERP